MNLFMKEKQTHRHRKQMYGYQGEGKESGKLGGWDLQMQVTTYEIDKQQCPAI